MITDAKLLITIKTVILCSILNSNVIFHNKLMLCLALNRLHTDVHFVEMMLRLIYVNVASNIKQ